MEQDGTGGNVNEVGSLDPTGTAQASDALRAAAGIARAGQRIPVPALPGGAGGVVAALRGLAEADAAVSAAVADAATDLAGRIDAVTEATVRADRAGMR